MRGGLFFDRALAHGADVPEQLECVDVTAKGVGGDPVAPQMAPLDAGAANGFDVDGFAVERGHDFLDGFQQLFGTDFAGAAFCRDPKSEPFPLIRLTSPTKTPSVLSNQGHNMFTKRIFLLSCLSSLFLLGTGFSQDKKPDLAAAHAIIDKFIEASGGKEALEKIKTRKMTAVMNMTAQGISAEMTTHQKKPNKMMVMVSIPGVMESKQIFDGKKAWSTDSIQGDRMLEGAELTQLAREADIARELRLKKLYPKMEVLPDEAVDGKSCKVIKATSTTGEEETWYFDAKSGLLNALSQSVATGPGGKMNMKMKMSDYKKIDGVQFPFKTVAVNPAMTMEIIIKEVEHNMTLPDSMFKIPEQEKKEKKEEGE